MACVWAAGVQMQKSPANLLRGGRPLGTSPLAGCVPTSMAVWRGGGGKMEIETIARLIDGITDVIEPHFSSKWADSE